MPRDTTPAYVVEVTTPAHRWTPAEWRARKRGPLPGYGQPTDANLARYVKAFEDSTKPGGVNAHLGETRVTRASIRRNTPGADPVASYTAPPAPAGPMFTVVAGGQHL